MSIPEELQGIVESTLQAVRAESEEIYSNQEEDVRRADMHFLVHEKLELVLGYVDVSEDEKRELRREIGRPLHLLVERGKI